MRRMLSKTTLSVFIVVFVTIFTLVGGFKILSDGIAIDKLSFADIQIRGLYLKLNNKFSLEIKELDLVKIMGQKPNSSTKPSLQSTLKDISDYVKYALWGLAYFENLRIEKIILGDNYTASVLYDGEHYALSFPKFQAVFNVQNQGNALDLDIRKLQIFEPNIEVAGHIIYSSASGQFGFGISLAPLLIDSSDQISASKSASKVFLQGTSDFKRLVLKAKTSKINNLEDIRMLVAQSAQNLLPTLDAWLFNALQFETLELDQADFHIVLHEKYFMQSLMKNTKLTLHAIKPTYKIHSTRVPFSANEARIQVKNGKATLDMVAPKLESIDLAGSKLEFMLKDSVPTLSIFATSNRLLYTQALRDLLELYGVHIPIDRISADMQANLAIHIPFASGAGIGLDGKLEAQNVIVSSNGVDFVSKSTSVAIDMNPKTENNYIDIAAQNLGYENLFDIDVKAHIDLVAKMLKTSLLVHSLRISTNPEVNQRLIDSQDAISPPRKQTRLDVSLQSKPMQVRKVFSLESTKAQGINDRLISIKPFTPKDMLATIAHFATAEQNGDVATSTTTSVESSADAVDSSEKDSSVTKLESTPSKSDATPSEEAVDFSIFDRADDAQDQETAHRELETLESILQDSSNDNFSDDGSESAKDISKQDLSQSTQNQTQNTDGQSRKDSGATGEMISPESTQDSSEDKSANPPNQSEIEDLAPQARTYRTNGVELDFTKPMSEQQMLEKIIALIKNQDKQKFTYDIFKATHRTLPQIDVNIDFSGDSVRVSVPALDVYMQIVGGSIHTNVVDFGKFAPFSPLMQYLGLSSGSAVVDIKSAQDLSFQVRIADFPTFLLSKDKAPLHTFTFNGTYANDKLQIVSDDGSMGLDLHDNTIIANFKDIDVSIDDLLESKIPAIQEAFSTSDEKKVVFTKEEILLESEFLRAKRRYERQHGIKPRIIVIQAQNIVGFFKDVAIPFDDFNAKIRDDRISADATYKNGIANIDIIHGNTIIKAGNFGAEFLNRVVGRDIVDGGLFELSGIYKHDMFNGNIHIQNTSFKGFAIVQNVIGLIDTIPSLVMFRSPGLSTKGYEVKQGDIKLALNTQYVGLESIDLIGKSMDMQGSGFIELESQEMDMGLSISTLKNLSGILNKIPIVGYLLLGKDGKVTTQVSVRGTIQDPKTQISLAQDLLTTPLKVLKRAFTPVDIVIDEIIKSVDQ